MKKTNSERTELLDHRAKQRQTGEIKTRILVVNDRPTVRQGLMQLINQQVNLEVCPEATSNEQALDAVDKQQVDLVIVDVSSGCTKDVQLVEKIKLQCPTMPILMLSVHNKSLNAECAAEKETEEYVENQQVKEKIIKAICYVQSLLKTQVHGFTILVKV